MTQKVITKERFEDALRAHGDLGEDEELVHVSGPRYGSYTVTVRDE